MNLPNRSETYKRYYKELFTISSRSCDYITKMVDKVNKIISMPLDVPFYSYLNYMADDSENEWLKENAEIAAHNRNKLVEFLIRQGYSECDARYLSTQRHPAPNNIRWINSDRNMAVMFKEFGDIIQTTNESKIVEAIGQTISIPSSRFLAHMKYALSKINEEKPENNPIYHILPMIYEKEMFDIGLLNATQRHAKKPDSEKKDKHEFKTVDDIFDSVFGDAFSKVFGKGGSGATSDGTGDVFTSIFGDSFSKIFENTDTRRQESSFILIDGKRYDKNNITKEIYDDLVKIISKEVLDALGIKINK